VAIAECAPHQRDGLLQVVVLDRHVGPQPFHQLPLALQRARGFDQEQEGVERLAGERHDLAAAEQSALPGLEPERAKAVDRGRLLGHRSEYE
jgi:hypothetical protein